MTSCIKISQKALKQIMQASEIKSTDFKITRRYMASLLAQAADSFSDSNLPNQASDIKDDYNYSGILIFRTSKGNENCFEKSEIREIVGTHSLLPPMNSVRLRRRKRLLRVEHDREVGEIGIPLNLNPMRYNSRLTKLWEFNYLRLLKSFS